ncbi:MAG TPA: antitoxin [Caulobacter sp.]|nr:antitoxin [Caulobacter sp.]
MSKSPSGFSEGPTPDFSHLTEEEYDAALIAEAEADFAAGRCVPHEDVALWLKTWGTPDYKPMPKAWLK